MPACNPVIFKKTRLKYSYIIVLIQTILKLTDNYVAISGTDAAPGWIWETG